MNHRYVAVLLAALLLFTGILSGCGTQPVETPTVPVERPTEPATEAPAEETALTVYAVNPDALYADAIDSFQAVMLDIPLKVTVFSSYDAMFAAMNDVNTPDVVLLDSMQGEIDGQTLAESGLFLPLDTFAAQLDPTIYPAALMDAGHIAGAQYFIPFSYNLIYAYTSQQRLTEMGRAAEDDLYGMILGEWEALAETPDKSPTSINIYSPAPVNSFFDAAGISLFDKTTGEATVDKAEVEAFCVFMKTVYDIMAKNALAGRFDRDFAGASRCFSFFTEDLSFMNEVRYYQSLFSAKAGTPMAALPYHRWNAPQELCASVVCFGGVGANTKMPEQAFTFLKYILDYNVSDNWADDEAVSEYYAPVGLTVYQKAVEKLSSTTGFGPVTVSPLSAENAELLTQTPRKITGAVIPNTALGLRLQTALEPYFLGQDSFDNCYNALLRELQSYLSE